MFLISISILLMCDGKLKSNEISGKSSISDCFIENTKLLFSKNVLYSNKISTVALSSLLIKSEKRIIFLLSNKLTIELGIRKKRLRCTSHMMLLLIPWVIKQFEKSLYILYLNLFLAILLICL